MHKCIVCFQDHQENIMIEGFPICLECEEVIVATDVDHPFYPLFIDQLKVIHAV